MFVGEDLFLEGCLTDLHELGLVFDRGLRPRCKLAQD
jgi:hypothetical protein